MAATRVDLSKPSNVVKAWVVKKAVYNELVKKIHAIQATNIRNLVKSSDYNTKIS